MLIGNNDDLIYIYQVHVHLVAVSLSFASLLSVMFVLSSPAFLVVLMWQAISLRWLDLYYIIITSAIVSYAEAVTVLNDNLVLPLYCIVTLFILNLGSWHNLAMVI